MGFAVSTWSTSKRSNRNGDSAAISPQLDYCRLKIENSDDLAASTFKIHFFARTESQTASISHSFTSQGALQSNPVSSTCVQFEEHHGSGYADFYLARRFLAVWLGVLPLLTGAIPRPGEVSLAHNGLLFLDELPEFPRNVLEVLRQPLEDGHVTIARAAMSLSFPARFMLAAAMNPCPCGYFNDKSRDCSCTPPMIQRYVSKVSGPLLDRIDIHMALPYIW